MDFVPFERSSLNPANEEAFAEVESGAEEIVMIQETQANGDVEPAYKKLIFRKYVPIWSLLPALMAIAMCWITREPFISLLTGVVSAAFLLGQWDLTGLVLEPSIGKAATIILLYLWMLGGLLGIWSRTGAAQAFAQMVSKRFVRGPRSAKLVGWLLGVIFFQGGTVSTVLVGTSVKPLADEHNVSHEELSYVVDSTASPIASQLAFNAWPGYIVPLIVVPGVPFLATEGDRLGFFFVSILFCFYATFAVIGTLLFALEKAPFVNRRLRLAMERARATGELDAPDAEPLSAPELQESQVPEGYRPHVSEFFLPLIVLIGVAIGTFIAFGTPKVTWAFGSAILIAAGMATFKGMALSDLIAGVNQGFKGVVMGSIILVLAVALGTLIRQTGADIYLVDLVGDWVPYVLLPAILFFLTLLIAFSTGSSWGTYAIAFPMAMPLAYAVAQSNGISPYLFMMVCFAAVMDGSVFGDQCSPISDTTVLSAMCTGCDLMDHVRTQIPQAAQAATIALILWTGITLIFV